ncbi:MAG: T9SS type A sorting domain-containing protein [Cyclobacteriaceae bacterium]
MINRQFLAVFSSVFFILVLNCSQAQNILFHAGFDDTLETADGEKPAQSFGVTYIDAIVNAGIEIDDGDIVQYDISNNTQASEGSITVWVKPNWKPGDNLYRIMAVSSSPTFELHVDEGSNLVFAMFSDQIETRVASVGVGDWQPGDWHHLAFNWSASKIEIFIDGINMGETSVGFDIPAFTTGTLNIGSSGGEQAFEGILDELMIYDAPQTAEQINDEYKATLNDFPNATAIGITDIFERNVTQSGITLVDWEGPIRNPAMKYYLKGNDSLSYPITITLKTSQERTSFNLPSEISKAGPSKTIELTSSDQLQSFLFSFYMDEDYENNSFDLELTYNQNGIPVRQVVPVLVIDQDRDRPLSYPVIVDFSEAIHELMVDPTTQAVITEAAEDWLYYIDGTEIDEIPEGESHIIAGGQDHLFDEKMLANPIAYTGYYLFAYGNTNAGPCVCSTGGPNRELLQSKNGEIVPIFRVGGLHLNVFGQAFETEPTGWEVIRPYENWTQEGYVGTDLYSLAKHEIGHAMVFENSPLFLEAQGRDPNNPFPDETLSPPPNGFRSPAITAYYPDEVVPLFENSLSHVIDVLDPASQLPPYGGGVPEEEEVMPGGREMMTKLDVLIMESVGYPLRENEVTRPLSMSSQGAFYGELNMDFSSSISAVGGIPVYNYSLSSGQLPKGVSLNSSTGVLSGIPEEEGTFQVTFEVKDYDERSIGATLEQTILIGVSLSNEARLLDYAFDESISIVTSTVDSATHTIYITVDPNTDITNLALEMDISTGATITPSPTELQDFTNPVSYTITSEDGSVSVTWTFLIDVLLDVNDLSNQVSIYPNPVKHRIYVELSESFKRPSSIFLHNMDGQMIIHSVLQKDKVSLSVAELPSGVYLLRVVNPDGFVQTNKVLIDH